MSQLKKKKRILYLAAATHLFYCQFYAFYDKKVSSLSKFQSGTGERCWLTCEAILVLVISQKNSACEYSASFLVELKHVEIMLKLLYIKRPQRSCFQTPSPSEHSKGEVTDSNLGRTTNKLRLTVATRQSFRLVFDNFVAYF